MTTQGPILAIDAVCNLHTPETVARRGPASLILDKVRATGETATGISIERLLEKMDTAGIERTFLIAAKEGVGRQQEWDGLAKREIGSVRAAP